MAFPPPASLHDSATGFYPRWRELDQWLADHRAFWQPAPFITPRPDWTHLFPELAERVAGFRQDQCELFAADPDQLVEAVADLLPSLSRLPQLTGVPRFDGPDSSLPEVRAPDMPGRKRLQAGAFTAAIRPLHSPVLDWCCGKGHLSRTLASWCPAPVSGFEWNPELVADGNRLALRAGDDVTVLCQDVMTGDCRLPPQVHGVALHACGELHRRLLTRAAEDQVARLSLSPCCYHLGVAQPYQPLSVRARDHRSALAGLGRDDLRLAVQETVTAPARVREQNNRITGWRLGFDGLQRELRGVNEYLPVPSHPQQLNRLGFEAFCRWAAETKGLELPVVLDFGYWQQYGQRRLSEVRRHELVRHLFRRPLEMWLVLDYALFLEEQGFRVRLGTFCDRALTPRNLLIDAVR